MTVTDDDAIMVDLLVAAGSLIAQHRRTMAHLQVCDLCVGDRSDSCADGRRHARRLSHACRVYMYYANSAEVRRGRPHRSLIDISDATALALAPVLVQATIQAITRVYPGAPVCMGCDRTSSLTVRCNVCTWSRPLCAVCGTQPAVGYPNFATKLLALHGAICRAGIAAQPTGTV